jgi:uncharacterized protein (DUF983 family)
VTDTVATNATTAAKRGSPFFMLATVGLLIAKYGFGLQIALLWCLAPLWIPVAIVLTLVLVPIILGGVVIGVILAGAWVMDEFNRRKWRKRNAAARALRT